MVSSHCLLEMEIWWSHDKSKGIQAKLGSPKKERWKSVWILSNCCAANWDDNTQVKTIQWAMFIRLHFCLPYQKCRINSARTFLKHTTGTDRCTKLLTSTGPDCWRRMLKAGQISSPKKVVLDMTIPTTEKIYTRSLEKETFLVMRSSIFGLRRLTSKWQRW